MINNASILDTRKLMTGKDGRVFIEFDGEHNKNPQQQTNKQPKK